MMHTFCHSSGSAFSSCIHMSWRSYPAQTLTKCIYIGCLPVKWHMPLKTELRPLCTICLWWAIPLVAVGCSWTSGGLKRDMLLKNFHPNPIPVPHSNPAYSTVIKLAWYDLHNDILGIANMSNRVTCSGVMWLLRAFKTELKSSCHLAQLFCSM